MKPLCIFGSGGSARETYWIAKRCGYEIKAFIDLVENNTYDGVSILKEGFFDPKMHQAVVAVGNCGLRKKISEGIAKYHGNVFLPSLIDPSVIRLSPHIKMGIGAVIAPQCVLTCNIEIGDFVQLNVGTSIMHDTKIGDYFTTAPGVRINGNVKIGNGVYFGSNASTKEGITIVDRITIGAGACVVKDINDRGTYVGVPAKRKVSK